MPELLPFISVDWIKPLAKRLQRTWEKRSAELAAISNTFGDPRPLDSSYVEPRVQYHDPADYHEDEDAISCVRAPAFETIDRFLGGDIPLGGGQTKLFILSDAGMGKTSLLLMRPNPKRSLAEQMVRPTRSLRFRPLLLAYVENLIGEGQDLLADRSESVVPAQGEEEEWNAYRLYDALVQAWLLREERKLASQPGDPPTKEVLLDLCTLVAVHLQAAGKRTLAGDEIAELTARQPAMAHLSELDGGGRSLLNRNADGSTGPVMQSIPAGTFRMGSPAGDKRADHDERPEHGVTFSEPFYLGRFPVTFEEFDRFCAAPGSIRVARLTSSSTADAVVPAIHAGMTGRRKRWVSPSSAHPAGGRGKVGVGLRTAMGSPRNTKDRSRRRERLSHRIRYFSRSFAANSLCRPQVPAGFNTIAPISLPGSGPPQGQGLDRPSSQSSSWSVR